MTPIIWFLFQQNTFMPVLTLATGIVLNLLTGLLLCVLLVIKEKTVVTLVLCLVSLSPFLAEVFAFKIAQVPLPLSNFLAVAAASVLLSWNTRLVLRVGVGAVLLCLALACYQGAAPTFAVTLAAYCLFQLRSPDSSLPPLLTSFWLSGLGTLVGLSLYALSVYLTFTLTGQKPHVELNGIYNITTNYRTSLTSMLDGLALIGALLTQFLFLSQHLIPLYIKAAFWVSLLLVLVGVARRQPGLVVKRAPRAILLGLSLVTLLLFPWLLVLVREGENAYRYNTLFSLGMVYATVVAASVSWTSVSILRKTALAAGWIVVIGFVYQHNIAAVGLHIMNERDKLIANRIIDRIERDPLYDNLGHVRPVALIGRLDYQQRWPFGANPSTGPIRTSLVRCSVLACQPGRLHHLLRWVQADRARYVHMRDGDALERALEYARTHAAWPSPQAVAVIDDFVVIILSHQDRRL